MKKGGYQIIDLENAPLEAGGDGVTIEGIYDLIEGTIKPIYLSGLVVDDIEYHDQYVDVGLYGGDYVLAYRTTDGEGFNITVDADDYVTVGQVTVEE